MGVTQERQQRVLVIEDSKVIRRLIEVCLRPLDVEIQLVGTGPDGLESAAIDTPDLVLLDIGLPGMDGWQVLDTLKSSGTACPVLMLTGHGELWSEQQAIERGAVEYMTKPFMPDSLRERISRHLPHRLAA